LSNFFSVNKSLQFPHKKYPSKFIIIICFYFLPRAKIGFVLVKRTNHFRNGCLACLGSFFLAFLKETFAFRNGGRKVYDGFMLGRMDHRQSSLLWQKKFASGLKTK